MTMNPYMQRCAVCGESWWDSHVCPKSLPAVFAPLPAPLLTEQRVREIVREELAHISTTLEK